MTILTVFFQMLSLVIMIGTGFCVSRKGMMDEHTNSQMSKMVADIFNPLLILSSAVNSVGLISLSELKLVGLVAVGMFLFFILVGILLSPLFAREPSQRPIYQMIFAFSNLGFIGILVVSSILGSEYVVYVTEFILVNALVIYTYGVVVLDGKFSLKSLKSMWNPGTFLSLLALAVIIFEIQVPSFLKTAVTYLGNVASPMALISVGFNLEHSERKEIFGDARLYVFSLVKLLVLPLLMLPVLRMVVPDSQVAAVCMIMFGMPAGNMNLMLMNQRQIDGTLCSASIILTTVLCVVTVPVLMVFF